MATLVQLETPVSVRALARHAGTSPQGALGVVNELGDAGIVLIERAGPSLMVSLNRQHLAAEAIIALVRLRGVLVRRLRQEVATLPGLAGAWLFGSAARGDGRRDSDVDLLLVAARSLDSAEWIEATDRLRQGVKLWTGNELQLVEHTQPSWDRLVKATNPLVAALRTDGIPLTEGSRALLRRAA